MPSGQYDFVVVANRLPVDKVGTTDDGEPLYETSPGGLVTALAPVMRSQHGAWVGWAGAPDESGDAFDSDGMHLVPVELSGQDVEDYYEGMSNGTLWPLFHDVIAAPEYHRHWWDAYVRVNRRFAEAAAAQADSGATVWVQDYQLLLVPAMLREQRPDLRIGFFNHIPFPGYEIFSQLPWRRQVIEGVLGSDLVGFQRRSDATNFLRACRRAAGATTRGSSVHVGHGGEGDGHRAVRAAAFPISIDARSFEELASDSAVVARAAEVRKELGDPDLVLLGVDRLDYTKGIRHRLSIFKELIEDGALGDKQVVLVQVASPSRERVKAYSDLRDEVELIVGRLNGDHGTVGWQPVHYLHQSFPRNEMAALYLAADVMLVTALRDGMNLVAKEYVAARHDDDGVLVLSEFAGAADELAQAVLVNPHDIDGTKAAITRAASMSREERRRRMRALRRRVKEHDVERWAQEFLGSLQGRVGARDGGSGIESGSGERER
ncbi:alpha,alpha-trehalose-phosphate synthase (UDP-forming) [Aquipuribacter sp. SD81]|uniref:alpha,alpha-trehalose-phosphate synthase (UDP-forming) n=1 Tax=Aquipuribacter sp. SD81 TaxID=3127703 RepID=UPI003016318E